MRKSCVIIDNMCKLVDDPREGFPLVPKIYPLVQQKIEMVADPEVLGRIRITARPGL